MKQRYVVLTIDTIAEILKDYVADEADIPVDALPVRLLLKPTEQGKLAIEMFSDSYKGTEAPLNIKFDIRRVFAVQ